MNSDHTCCVLITDIFYTYANEATRRSGTVFTEDEKATLLDKHHNLGDMMLYEHFNKTFWEKIELQPEFFDEVVLQIQFIFRLTMAT